MNRKPRILLIPNVAWWIIGEMGKQIIARFSDKYDFYFVPEGIFERRSELLEAFIPGVDAIHCLNESSIELFRRFDPANLPPIVAWIHHVTEWSAQHQLSAERSAAITVCTEEWKRDISGRLSREVPVVVVPHGVDLQFFSPRQVPAGSFGIPANKFVVGFLGTKGSDSDRGRKGTDTLLQVIRSAAEQLPDLHVVLCGPGWESELQNLHELGVSASATGYIPKSDLPLLYSALDVYLMTSRVEGGPCTVFEAMSCGTPVVATRVGAVPELIVDGVNGCSAEVDDVPALVAGLAMLDRNPVKRREIAVAARETVSQLPWGAALTPLEALYDSLVPERRSVQRDPAWMNNPQKIFQASSAADAIAHTLARVQKGKLHPRQAIRSLSEMLDQKPSLDLIRGLAMLRGWSYR
jgi:glycosyltransferase involved in cell wall biosynthesis